MRVYSTIPIEVTRIGEHLNTISTTVARNPVIEEVTGHDFLVYLTYSYDEEDRLGWVFSSMFGLYEGTKADTDEEISSSIINCDPFYRGSTWYETREEALKAQEEWEAQIATAAFSQATEPFGGTLEEKSGLAPWGDSTPRKPWYKRLTTWPGPS